MTQVGMKSGEWRRVRDLFEQALGVAPADLDAWLAGQTGVDDAVREEVRSLMAQHSRAGRFLSQALVERHPELVGEDEALVEGAVVGSYTILREIGRGGMGRVYLARDVRLDRDVALKALAPHLTGDPAYRERLRREARAAASLSHPGICTVYALEEVEGALYIATEFVDGCTLREEIAAGRPGGDRVLRTFRELAAALAAAHARGIAHRDLKPENVMRTRDGRLKVLDFGLAQLVDSTRPEASAVTRPGLLIGTPAYMAPEQLRGQPADARADVFALGVLMYEYACGEHPFAAPNELAVAARVLESAPQPLAERGVTIPAGVAATIERALRKNPGERFASAGEILQELDREREPSAAAGASRARPIVGWWRTHQAASMGLYVAATIVAWEIKQRVGGAAATWVFVGVGVASAAAGIARGHMLFTEWANRARLPTERRRASPLTRLGDLAITAGLLGDGLLLAPGQPLWAMLTMAFALGVALAAFLMEPATTNSVFDDARD
ncbi:MAG: serine/threonine-protein kinase [Betaproteobacteria bacterium]